MDLRSKKDRAHRLRAAGRFAKAAELYLALVREQPDDPSLRLGHAECARRAGTALAAVASYQRAAELHVQLGHHARARAVLRQALELAPSHPQLMRALSELEPKGESIESAVMELAEAGAELDIEVELLEPMPESVIELPAPEAAPLSAARDVHVLSPTTVAVRKSSGDGWWIISSSAPVQVTEVALEAEDEPVLAGVALAVV